MSTFLPFQTKKTMSTFPKWRYGQFRSCLTLDIMGGGWGGRLNFFSYRIAYWAKLEYVLTLNEYVNSCLSFNFDLRPFWRDSDVFIRFDLSFHATNWGLSEDWKMWFFKQKLPWNSHKTIFTLAKDLFKMLPHILALI